MWSLEWAIRGKAAPYKTSVDQLGADQSVVENGEAASFVGCFGQDACAVYSNTTKSCHLLSVADGVGGWNKFGYDSGVLARELVTQLLVTAPSSSSSSSLPQDLLASAFTTIKAQGLVKGGSTTVCVAMLDVVDGEEGAHLRTANLGDCGYALFRDDKLIYLSEQQRSGNTPMQMAIIPDELLRDESSFCNCDPSSADVQSHRVQHGDIVLLASDGLWDNLYLPHSVTLEQWWTLQDRKVNLTAATNKLFGYALDRMKRPLLPDERKRGKPDDMVVLLARICFE